MNSYKKSCFIIIYLLISIYSSSQKAVVVNQGDKFKIININNIGFYFNYLNYDKELYLLNDTYQLENKNKLTRDYYNSINLNILSSENKIGEIYFRDTIYYKSNLNIDDIDNVVRGILYQNHLREFDYNKNGIYYFNVFCDINWYQGVYLNYKIFLNEKYAILECRQTQTFSITEGDNPEFEDTGMDYYNSKKIGIDDSNYQNINGIIENSKRFRKNKAYNQLYFISILNDVRTGIKNYFTEYIYDISEQKTYLNIK